MNNADTLTQPKTLLDAVQYFSDPDRCLNFLVALRWPEGVTCPHCGTTEPRFMEKRRVWQCNNKQCRKQFSIKTGTIFEDSPLSLSKWLPTMWLIVNAKNGVSSWEVHRAIGVTQKTAWFMLHRIRLAMQTEDFDKLSGTVEADETLIGGSLRFMHPDRKAQAKGRTHDGKVIVMGLLERHGKVKTTVVPDQTKKTLQAQVKQHVDPGAEVFTDELASYEGLSPEYVHDTINHAETYVRGRVHTNCIENYWCLFKRCIKGTYVSVEPFHLFRYLDEEDFRFNSRKSTDAARFTAAVASVAGKRVTYKELIGDATALESSALGVVV